MHEDSSLRDLDGANENVVSTDLFFLGMVVADLDTTLVDQETIFFFFVASKGGLESVGNLMTPGTF